MRQRRLVVDEPFFILDNGLNPNIARALSEFGIRIRSVQDEFGDSKGSTKDPDIIEHIARNYGFRGVWITKDISSKRIHGELIYTQAISVIWIRQQVLSTEQQLRIIVYCYPRAYQDLVEATRAKHYIVTFTGERNRERINLIPERAARRRQRGRNK